MPLASFSRSTFGHSSVSQVRSSSPSSSLIPPTYGIKTLDHPIQRSSAEDREKLERHLKQRVKDQEAAKEWNTNAEGRNQGVAHLIDYSYARPPMTKTDPRANNLSDTQRVQLEKLDQKMMSQSKLEEEGMYDKNTQPFLEERLKTDGKKVYMPPGVTSSDWTEVAGDASDPETALKTLENERKKKIKSLIGEAPGHLTGKEKGAFITAQKNQAKDNPEVKSLEAKIERVKTMRRFGLKRDESKKGRLALLAAEGKRMGIGSQDEGIVRGKEMESGTAIAKTLLNHGQATLPTTLGSPPQNPQVSASVEQPKAPQKNLKQWVGTPVWKPKPKGPAGAYEKRMKYELKETPPEKLMHTVGAEVKGTNVKAKLWSPVSNPDASKADQLKALKFSTVMGAKRSKGKS